MQLINATKIPQPEPYLQQTGSVKNLDNDIQSGALNEVNRRMTDYQTPEGWNGLQWHPPYPLNTEGFLQAGKNQRALDDAKQVLTDSNYGQLVDGIRPEEVNSYVLGKLRDMKLPRQDNDGNPEIVPVNESSKGMSLGVPGDSDSYPSGSAELIETQQKLKKLKDLLSSKGSA